MSWYYAVDGQQAGPVEDDEMQRLFSTGAVTPRTLVWRAGMENWAPISTLMATAPAGPMVTCMNCRKSVLAADALSMVDGNVCLECKPIVLQQIREGVTTMRSYRRYAGFWIRLVAKMIDGTITGIIGYVLQLPMLLVIARPGASAAQDMPLFFAATAFAVIMSLAAGCYYEAYFLVKQGATPGKMILGLKVIRPDGRGISWGVGVGRYFAHMLNGFTLYIGYMMAGWDDEKRALHDRVCDTRVVFGS